MGERVTVVIACDGCGIRRNGRSGGTHGRPQSSADLRQLLDQVGWSCSERSDTDLCPSCVHAVEQAEGVTPLV